MVVRVGHDDFLFLLPPLHTEDVLHPGLFADAINVAEREQVAGPGILSAGDGAGRAGREADRADGAALAVRDEQFARANGESGRLRPGGLKWIGVVEVLLGAVAAEVVGDFLFKIVRPNLVCAGHGDEHLAALDVHVPRGADDLFASASSAVVVTPLCAVADQCGHGLGFGVDHAQGVVFRVGHVQVVPVQRESLQPEKPGLVVGSVDQSDSAGADRFDEFSVEIGYDDAVVV